MTQQKWQFWIDVGGTFTDCLALSPGGEQLQTKILSSGLCKGRIANASGKTIHDPGRRDDPPGFWNGATIKFYDRQGHLVSENQVESFDKVTANIECVSPIDQTIDHAKYELDAGELAPILAIRLLTQTAPRSALPPCDVHLGTTRGTNALLTRQGARTALVTTKGFRDLLRIGDQARPHLFELTIRKPKPLFENSIEVDERILADGTVEQAPDQNAVKRQLEELKDVGIESIAVCLMHGYRFDQHEKIVGDIACKIGFDEVRLSSEVAPLIKIVPRGETTVLDAYLNPVIGKYLDQIQSVLGAGSQLRLMTSAGGLASRMRFTAKDSVLSGPAGGVVGAARIAQQAGFSHAIGFDMGGTSTDVSRFDGAFEREFEAQKAGVRIVTPMLVIETVAAGGGSICKFDGTRLVVGPESAGADPGPACYGRGGPLAVTDLNCFLGRLDQRHFPFELDQQPVANRLAEISEQLAETGTRINLQELAEGFLKIANNNMASAIRSVSVARGYDPRQYVLVSFGGAGSQHSCAVADQLGITRILDHPQSSILSAVGIRLADRTISTVRSVLEEYSADAVAGLAGVFAEMEKTASDRLVDEGCKREEIERSRSLDLRYQGTADCQTITQPSDADYESVFASEHQRLFGYVQDRKLEIVAARVDAKATGYRLPDLSRPQPTRLMQKSELTQRLYHAGQELDAIVYDRDQLKSGGIIRGPAVVSDRLSTVIIEPTWEATVFTEGQLLIEKKLGLEASKDKSSEDIHNQADPITLEIFNNHFSSIARQMGISLQKTSISVNVKERLDFSCAVFTSDGDLVVNAPHIPVHLGAMSETVRATIRMNDDISPGDVFVTNDPYAGGSHLPDVTVISPVFEPIDNRLVFWVASRSHHAEIGGKAPGSMPAHATNLAEEGVLIQNFKLMNRGNERFAQLAELLTSGSYPSRCPAENIADIRAQVAANRTGENALLDLVAKHSVEKILAYMHYIQDAAEQKTRSSLARLPDGKFEFADSMDNGATIRVEIEKLDDQLKVDFTGTDPVLPGNLNANKAIVSSAVMYVMRSLINEDIPLNQGVMKPVTITLPECFLNPTPGATAEDSPAIVGGNVETSQRIVDVLLGALGLAAASQGTMNNWLVGDDSFGYYETVGGGSGATRAGHGADAVHCHMSNTRLTDPEILETRYPMILREFSVRTSSGGNGKHRGGNGIIREIEFTKPLTLSLLTSRRTTKPFGLNGGGPAKRGENLLIDGEGVSQLESQCEVQVTAGQSLRLSTPGGGGFGK